MCPLNIQCGLECPADFLGRVRIEVGQAARKEDVEPRVRQPESDVEGVEVLLDGRTAVSVHDHNRLVFTRYCRGDVVGLADVGRHVAGQTELFNTLRERRVGRRIRRAHGKESRRISVVRDGRVRWVRR